MDLACTAAHASDCQVNLEIDNAYQKIIRRVTSTNQVMLKMDKVQSEAIGYDWSENP